MTLIGSLKNRSVSRMERRRPTEHTTMLAMTAGKWNPVRRRSLLLIDGKRLVNTDARRRSHP